MFLTPTTSSTAPSVNLSATSWMNNGMNSNTIIDHTTLINDNTNSLYEKLQKWVLDFHVSHNCVNALLSILRSEGLKLPKDARTLINTPKTGDHKIISIHPGSYIHLGVEYMISKILSLYLCDIDNNITIQLSVNIDGLPLTSSSKSSFWPILVSFINLTKLLNTVIPVGIYHGKFKKPSSSHEFLNPFITEMNTILTNGLSINNKIFKFEVSQIVCDAPAKSFVLNVKNFNAYHGCNSCVVEGTFLNNRMAFLDINAPLRTNETFRNKCDEFYHKDSSPLEELPINITSSVVLEYMHNICLGVMKKLIVFWTKGKKPVRLVNPDDISDELDNIKSYLPSEFKRISRTLEEVEYWKATEFRNFLLYIGPIVLKCRLRKSLYKHFMLLSCAVRLLISPETCHAYNNVARDLLNQFVTEYSSHYGEEYVGYNVHGLIHVCDFVLIHGALDSFSAFKFENYLQFIKKSSKNSRYPLQDVYNRIIEQINAKTNNITFSYPILKHELPYDKILNNSITDILYEQIVLEQFIVSSKHVKDKYFIIQNYDIIKVNKIIKYFNGEIKIEVTKFKCSSFFDNPISSDLIKIFYIDAIIPEPQPQLINLDCLKYKCLTVPIDKNKHVAIALLHSKTTTE